jgi:signal transduction histidine kinase
MLEDLRAFQASPFEVTLCEPGPILEQCVSLYRTQARHEGVELELHAAAALPTVAIGAGPLLQIIHNLLQNALQAMAGHGRIAVRGSSSLREVTLEVEDTGPGIPPASVPYIFEPFYTTKEKGTGLGLSICQRLLADAGGRIKLARTGPEGTAFTVHLPRADV